jgi:hypothetical protein
MIVLEVLEKVLSEIDERLDSQSPMQIYIRNFELMKKNSDALKEIQDDHANEGYVRVRKV